MDNLIRVQCSEFGSILCDFYGNTHGEFFMTRQQIGEALKYNDPNKQINKLHQRHKERLDGYSTTVTMGVVEGSRKVNREMVVYSAKGIYEICRWSRQPKANEFYDHVYEILEGLRLGYMKLSLEHQSTHWQQTRLVSKTNRRLETDEIKVFVQYALEHGSKNAERYYCTLSKLANKAVGIESDSRDGATTNQLNNLILVENIINNCIQEGIGKQEYYKEIYTSCKERIEQFRRIAYLQKTA